MKAESIASNVIKEDITKIYAWNPTDAFSVSQKVILAQNACIKSYVENVDYFNMILETKNSEDAKK